MAQDEIHCLAGRAHFCLGGVPRASGLWKPKPRPMRWSMSMSEEDSECLSVVRGMASASAKMPRRLKDDFVGPLRDPIGVARSLAGVTDAASPQGGGPGSLWRRRVKRCGVI